MKSVTSFLAVLLLSCSVTLDDDKSQCRTNQDCRAFHPNAVCDAKLKVCVRNPAVPRDCDLVQLPRREDIPTHAGDLHDFTVVVSAHDYGGELDGRNAIYNEFGFDLDGACSTNEQPLSCRPPGWLAPRVADFAGGRDNAHANAEDAAWEVLGSTVFSTQIVTNAIRAGIITPPGLIRVKRYSGKVMDDDLDVEWFAPVRILPRGDEAKPRFDGTDAWIVTSGSIDDATDPDPNRWTGKYRAYEAFVQQYTLIARFDAPVEFSEVGLIRTLHGLTLVGKLEQDYVRKKWRFVDGTIMGLMPEKQGLGFIPFAAKYLLGLPPVCADDPQYFNYKEPICAACDTIHSGGGNPRERCDAWSIMLRLTTTWAQIAGVHDPPNHDDLCPYEVSPARDSCDTRLGPFLAP